MTAPPPAMTCERHCPRASVRSTCEQVPGKPVSVVCDDERAIKTGVSDHWGRGAVHIHQCEHHLAENCWAAMKLDVIPFDDPVRELFKTALHSRANWDAFVATVDANPRTAATRKWAHQWNVRLRIQTERRDRIPQRFANGAVEEPLRTIRAAIDHRKFCVRNRARMNPMLEQMRLSANKDDIVRIYAEDIRNHLTTADPERARRYRTTYDPWGASGTPENPRIRVYSLFGESAYEGQWA